MRIGTLRVDLHIPAAQSLKAKRRVVRSLKDQIFARFNASVAEIDALDLWQRAIIGIAVVGNESTYIDGVLQKIEAFTRRHPGAIVIGIDRNILDPGENGGDWT